MAALTLASSGAAHANSPAEAQRLSTYVAARAADSWGDSVTAARLFAALARDFPANTELRQRAIAGAIQAGDMRLALDLGRGIAFDRAPLELRMLMISDLLLRGRSEEAVQTLRSAGGTIDSGFLLPFVEAWARADRKDPRALQSLESVNPQSALARQLDEHRALILLKLRRPREALPFARQALAEAGGRADRLRLAFADGFRAAGDATSAAAMLEGQGAALSLARARLASNRPLGEAIDSGPKAFGELLLGLAIALNRLEDKTISVSLAQVARHSNPDNDAAILLLGLLLDEAGRPEPALAALRSIPSGANFAAQAEDAEVRILLDNGRGEQALTRARQFANTVPSADSFARLGGVLTRLERFEEAAAAYASAIRMVPGGSSDALWELELYRASALEEAGRWADAKEAAQAALTASPENSLVLNFLGYGMLERGENLDAAEAMVRKASALRPDDASITDSLGWAQFKRGKVAEAIGTLTRAATADPGQWEIREHLGDALYTAGRRIEARFEWRAALAAAEDEAIRARIAAKLERGLTAASAAP